MRPVARKWEYQCAVTVSVAVCPLTAMAQLVVLVLGRVRVVRLLALAEVARSLSSSRRGGFPQAL